MAKPINIDICSKLAWIGQDLNTVKHHGNPRWPSLLPVLIVPKTEKLAALATIY